MAESGAGRTGLDGKTTLGRKPEGWFEFFAWWTRTQRTRTVAQMPFAVALLETALQPVYQQVAKKALHLRELGLSLSAIARKLEVDDKTVAKAVRWLGGMEP